MGSKDVHRWENIEWAGNGPSVLLSSMGGVRSLRMNGRQQISPVSEPTSLEWREEVLLESVGLFFSKFWYQAILSVTVLTQAKVIIKITVKPQLYCCQERTILSPQGHETFREWGFRHAQHYG